jgi:hypothetical protein
LPKCEANAESRCFRALSGHDCQRNIFHTLLADFRQLGRRTIGVEGMASDVFQTDFSPGLAHSYFEQMEREGFCCVHAAISPETLESFRREIKRLVGLNGRKFLFLVNPYKYKDSVFKALASSNNFTQFLLQLSNLGTKTDNSDFELLNVLRVVPGDKSTGQALNFHYDAEIVTALVPIDIPEGPPEKAGHLVAIPNLRKVRKYVVHNMLEKLLLQNRIAGKLISFLALRKKSQKYIFKLVPGNVYFFWGYRTLHANLPVDSKETRSTLLFHFGNPHKNSSLMRFIKNRHYRLDIFEKT